MGSIYYSDKGAGPPIILLHGFCETHAIWEEFSQALSTDYRVIAPDLPGFGESHLPLNPFTIADIGNLLILWLSGLNLDKPIIIGHSLGGYIALAMAEKNPDYFDGIGLFHSTPFPDSEEKKINRNRTIDFVKTYGVPAFVETFVPGLFFQKQHPAIPFIKKIALSTSMECFVAYTIAMRDRPSMEEFLRVCSINRLILAGKHDSFITLESSEKMASLSFNTYYRILENAGHLAMFENFPDALTGMREFIMLCRSKRD